MNLNHYISQFRKDRVSRFESYGWQVKQSMGTLSLPNQVAHGCGSMQQKTMNVLRYFQSCT